MRPQLQNQTESVVSKRNVNSLMDGEFYTSEVRSWSNTPSCVTRGGPGMEVVFAPGTG